MSGLNLGFVLLFVKNPLLSKEFYGRLLKIRPVEESPTFVLFILPNGLKLGLWSLKTAEPPVTVTGGGCELAFSEEDVDGVYAQWKQMGIPIAQAPTDMDFGRTFMATDPDGHRLRVFKLWEEERS